MAEFLTTSGISYRLEEIIKNANDRLIIISPYLKVNDRLKGLLEDKNRMKINVRVIYGKNELQPSENNWLASMDSIWTGFCKNLHAKCYLNENEALLTSMNLYEFSQRNNEEMGILASRDKDSALYDEIYQESMRLVRLSEGTRVTVARVDNAENDNRRSSVADTQRKPEPTLAAPREGFCIRCKSAIPASKPVRPYCPRCFTSWNRWKNEDYEEKHCHVCGNEHSATMAKPLCRDCYRKYKDVLEFAVS